MLFWTTPTVRFSWLQQQARAVPSPCAISQTTTFWRHNCHAACKKAGTPTMISYYLRTSFFITVGPLGSPLTSSTKPSRCSTRRTAEARRWTPTDLLKAFHLREMATANIPDARQQALVSTWENAPPRIRSIPVRRLPVPEPTMVTLRKCYGSSIRSRQHRRIQGYRIEQSQQSVQLIEDLYLRL